MATKFKDFIRDLENEAAKEGPQAVEQLKAFRTHFRIGRELAQARKRLRLTQQQLAKRADIDQAEVSNIERGVANPTFNTLSAVVSAVGMEIALKRSRRRSA